MQYLNAKGFIPYVTAGFWNLDYTFAVLEVFAKNGVKLIEVGVPFSDPVADGLVIQSAHGIAVQNGVGLVAVLELVERFKKLYPTVEIVLMGYFNSFFQIDVRGGDFVMSLKKSKVDGVLIVDLPFEYGDAVFKRLNIAEVKVVNIVTNETSDARLQKIISVTTGFLYCMSHSNITGASVTSFDNVKGLIQKIRDKSDLPLCVGFGIKTRRNVKEVLEFADGAIVGSVIAECIFDSKESIGNCDRLIKDLLAD